MGDAALHTLFGDISRLGSFAAIMLGEHPLEPSEDARSLARMAEGLARDRHRRSDPAGTPPDDDRPAVFRAAYLLARERPSSHPTPNDGADRAPKRVRALRALSYLRHRQRAALTLRYVLGFSAADVSSIIGTSAKVTDGVIRSGLQAIVRRVGGSVVDARRTLRAAGATIGKGAGARPMPRRSAREPRAVVRLLLAPPPGAEAPSAAPSGARAGLLWLPHPVYVPWQAPARPATPAAPSKPAAGRMTARWERVIAAAAVIVVLMSLAFVPRSSPTPRAPLAVVPLAPRIAADEASRPPVPVAAAYRVRAGDTLWSIAERELGDPFRWPTVWRKNAGKPMTGGARFTDPDRIRPGWVLALPSKRPG